MNILKKIYPYFIIPLIMLYINIIAKMSFLYKNSPIDSNFNSTLPFFIGDGFFFTNVTMPLISMMFGMLLELLTRKPAALKIKINGSFMTIAFIVGFLYYMPYTPAFVLFTYINVNPVLIRSAPAVYLIPTLAGFCLTKGLLASKESAND
ncbi:hypothetical protein ACIZ62_14690 [Acetobacterium carbinolicum]|uniref:hypothetical protein n=1 Tax=Acetobacterium carbinolicum TaxID=52690 RepID=UPI0039BFD79A